MIVFLAGRDQRRLRWSVGRGRDLRTQPRDPAGCFRGGRRGDVATRPHPAHRHRARAWRRSASRSACGCSPTPGRAPAGCCGPRRSAGPNACGRSPRTILAAAARRRDGRRPGCHGHVARGASRRRSRHRLVTRCRGRAARRTALAARAVRTARTPHPARMVRRRGRHRVDARRHRQDRGRVAARLGEQPARQVRRARGLPRPIPRHRVPVRGYRRRPPSGRADCATAADETSGRLVHLLSGPTGRAAFFTGRLVISAVAVTASAVAAGAAIWVGAAAQGLSGAHRPAAGSRAQRCPTALVALGSARSSSRARRALPQRRPYGVVAGSLILDLVASMCRMPAGSIPVVVPLPSPGAVGADRRMDDRHDPRRGAGARALATAVYSRRDVYPDPVPIRDHAGHSQGGDAVPDRDTAARQPRLTA